MVRRLIANWHERVVFDRCTLQAAFDDGTPAAGA
jgi:hypothetical protein